MMNLNDLSYFFFQIYINISSYDDIFCKKITKRGNSLHNRIFLSPPTLPGGRVEHKRDVVPRQRPYPATRFSHIHTPPSLSFYPPLPITVGAVVHDDFSLIFLPNNTFPLAPGAFPNIFSIHHFHHQYYICKNYYIYLTVKIS